MTRKQAGQRGGLATVRKHGREHMQQIGRRGASVTWQRYFLSPVGGTGWVMIDRSSHEVKAVINFVDRR
jgi:hypothetical protein